MLLQHQQNKIQNVIYFYRETFREIRVNYQLDAIFVYFSSTCFGLTPPSSGAIAYGPLNETMHLLKQVNKTTSLIPYECLYIQTLHQAGKLIPEQYPGDPNPLLQAVIVPHSTQT